ncbi:MAG TPA: hypothetical protein VGZ47_15055 [Gemmataceae bacterium]|jgi:hypothetical protein|nr:hypothetical protein [Gemmataceae bacterium]
MSVPAHELRDFHDFLGERLSNGGGELSPEEALDEWRRLHPHSGVIDDEAAAIQEALDDLAGGEQAKAFEDFDREFRKRHRLPARP